MRYAIDKAKSVNMPRDTIEKAIKKATGEAGGASFTEVIYEGYGPSGGGPLYAGDTIGPR